MINNSNINTPNTTSHSIQPTKMLLNTNSTNPVIETHHTNTDVNNITITITTTSANVSLSVCGNNQYVCNSISHPICKYLLRYPILSQAHHKTGWILSAALINDLSSFCGLQPNNISKLVVRHLTLNPQSLNQTLYGTNFQTAILFHWLRDPVDTILSGFYYHLKAGERWLHSKISKSQHQFYKVHNNDLYQDVIESNIDKTDYFNKYWVLAKEVKPCLNIPGNFSYIIYEKYKVRNEWTLTQFYNALHVGNAPVSMVRANTQSNGHIRGYSRNTNPSIHKIENITDDAMGLFWEFIRYFNCEWPHQYLMYQVGRKYFHNNYIIFDLGSFESIIGFDDNIERLLDAINIVDNEENMMILNKYGVNMSINNERDVLRTMMTKEDLNRHGIRNDKRGHSTKGSYDKHKSIELLLSVDKFVCQLIKNMTVLLHYEWKYIIYC